MTIRRAVPDDAAAIARVHVRTWQAAYRGLLPDQLLDGLDAELEGRTSWWRRRIADAGGRGQVQLVAEHGSVVVGFVAFGPPEDEPRDARVGQVYAIYVDPEHWGDGHGRALFAAAEGGLAEAGFTEATLWVLATNVRARRFYEIAGWRPDGAAKTERRGEVDLHEVRYRRAPLG